ncbi:periplasmic heavy metal sensor [Brevundimonas sp.]|uniref:periplasmic heavy metal sensor n=1 Tax=Brevundimonas sp. TaxID=1871086 RepID=UPI002D759F73|nr:periplasmic heavy metal sensor [Brevundimonas sp.]HYC97389.1 periplasmic heavy metal sensor [Brevundimonas sp.]
MNARTLKIALAASVALNLFALAAGATLLVGRANVERRIEAQHRAPRDHPFMTLVEGLDPAVRDRVRDTLRASARAARPDFEETRLKRRQATALARSADFDPAEVSALLEQSRAAELRGRARLEEDAVALLGTLEPDDRAALSEILTRRGRTVVRDKGDRKAREAASHPAA